VEVQLSGGVYWTLLWKIKCDDWRYGLSLTPQVCIHFQAGTQSAKHSKASNPLKLPEDDQIKALRQEGRLMSDLLINYFAGVCWEGC